MSKTKDKPVAKSDIPDAEVTTTFGLRADDGKGGQTQLETTDRAAFEKIFLVLEKDVIVVNEIISYPKGKDFKLTTLK